MIKNSIPESNCKYLFGKEAEDIYTRLKYPKDKINKSDFIDCCLDLTMRVHRHLFTHKNAILMLDPRAFNKQCHLYALKAVQISRTYHQKSEEEKMAQNKENRFLHLGFSLNYAFRDKENYVQTILSTLGMMNIYRGSDKLPMRHFIHFLKDEYGQREKASRQAFNQVFKMNIRMALHRDLGDDALSYELMQLSYKNLQMNGTSLSTNVEPLYTYPKLSGLAYMVEVIAQERIPMVFKIKVCTNEGYGGMVSQSNGLVENNSSVVVFTGFATDGSFSATECAEKAKKCPTYLYRHSDPIYRHEETAKCFYCTPINMDLQPYQENLNKIMQSSTEVLFALGAEFMMQEQKPLLHLFQSHEYPELKELFASSLSKIDQVSHFKEGVSTFAIYHTIAEDAMNALSDEFPLDSNPKAFLLKNGLMAHKSMKKSQLEDFIRDDGLMQLSRAERKSALVMYEKTFKNQGYMVRSRRERFPKVKAEAAVKLKTPQYRDIGL